MHTGGSFIIHLNSVGLANSPVTNDFYHVKNFIKRFVPLSAMAMCKKSAVLINSHIISVVLEAKEAGNAAAQKCMAECYNMAESINKARETMVNSNIAKYLRATTQSTRNSHGSSRGQRRKGNDHIRTMVGSGSSCCWPSLLIVMMTFLLILMLSCEL